MTTPDLVFQTKLHKKLKPETLGHGHHVSTFKILSAHFLDFAMIYGLSVLCSHFFNQTFSQFMITDSLEKAWSRAGHHAEFFACLTTLMVSYFFFSFFFNRGQSLGMKFQKLRVIVPEHSLKDSAKAALASLSLFVSGGLSLNQVEHLFVPHDHLYLELVQVRDQHPLNLVDSIETANDWNEEVREAA